MSDHIFVRDRGDRAAAEHLGELLAVGGDAGGVGFGDVLQFRIGVDDGPHVPGMVQFGEDRPDHFDLVGAGDVEGKAVAEEGKGLAGAGEEWGGDGAGDPGGAVGAGGLTWAFRKSVRSSTSCLVPTIGGMKRW